MDMNNIFEKIIKNIFDNISKDEYINLIENLKIYVKEDFIIPKDIYDSFISFKNLLENIEISLKNIDILNDIFKVIGFKLGEEIIQKELIDDDKRKHDIIIDFILKNLESQSHFREIVGLCIIIPDIKEKRLKEVLKILEERNYLSPGFYTNIFDIIKITKNLYFESLLKKEIEKLDFNNQNNKVNKLFDKKRLLHANLLWELSLNFGSKIDFFIVIINDICKINIEKKEERREVRLKFLDVFKLLEEYKFISCGNYDILLDNLGEFFDISVYEIKTIINYYKNKIDLAP